MICQKIHTPLPLGDLGAQNEAEQKLNPAGSTQKNHVKEARVEIFIYGLKVGNHFVYVGQSLDPKRRHYRHLTSKGETRIVILRSCAPEDAFRIEMQIIRNLKSKGQCSLNKLLVKNNDAIVNRGGNPVIYKGVLYESWAALARKLDSAVATLKRQGILPNVNGSGRF